MRASEKELWYDDQHTAREEREHKEYLINLLSGWFYNLLRL